MTCCDICNKTIVNNLERHKIFCNKFTNEPSKEDYSDRNNEMEFQSIRSDVLDASIISSSQTQGTRHRIRTITAQQYSSDYNNDDYSNDYYSNDDYDNNYDGNNNQQSYKVVNGSFSSSDHDDDDLLWEMYFEKTNDDTLAGQSSSNQVHTEDGIPIMDLRDLPKTEYMRLLERMTL